MIYNHNACNPAYEISYYLHYRENYQQILKYFVCRGFAIDHTTKHADQKNDILFELDDKYIGLQQ